MPTRRGFLGGIFGGLAVWLGWKTPKPANARGTAGLMIQAAEYYDPDLYFKPGCLKQYCEKYYPELMVKGIWGEYTYAAGDTFDDGIWYGGEEIKANSFLEKGIPNIHIFMSDFMRPKTLCSKSGKRYRLMPLYMHVDYYSKIVRWGIKITPERKES